MFIDLFLPLFKLITFLPQVPETKDLVIDPQLMKPLDHFTGASFLKVILLKKFLSFHQC